MPSYTPFSSKNCARATDCIQANTKRPGAMHKRINVSELGRAPKRHKADYDPKQALADRLEIFTAPRNKDTDKKESKPSTFIGANLAAVAEARQPLWLVCGESTVGGRPKRARLVGAHDAAAENIVVACTCEWCLENSHVTFGRRKSSTPASAASRGESAGAAADLRQSSSAAGGSAVTANRTCAFQGRLFNLPQWYEHCTQRQVIRLDEHPDHYRDLLFSAVFVDPCGSAAAAGARWGSVSPQGPAGWKTQKQSLREYLSRLVKSEASRVAQRRLAVKQVARQQPPAAALGSQEEVQAADGGSDSAGSDDGERGRGGGACGGRRPFTVSSALKGLRVHVYYDEELPAGRWFSGTVLRLRKKICLQVRWDAWVDPVSEVHSESISDVVLGITNLHFGEQPPSVGSPDLLGPHVPLAPLPSLLYDTSAAAEAAAVIGQQQPTDGAGGGRGRGRGRGRRPGVGGRGRGRHAEQSADGLAAAAASGGCGGVGGKKQGTSGSGGGGSVGGLDGGMETDFEQLPLSERRRLLRLKQGHAGPEGSPVPGPAQPEVLKLTPPVQAQRVVGPQEEGKAAGRQRTPQHLQGLGKLEDVAGELELSGLLRNSDADCGEPPSSREAHGPEGKRRGTPGRQQQLRKVVGNDQHHGGGTQLGQRRGMEKDEGLGPSLPPLPPPPSQQPQQAGSGGGPRPGQARSHGASLQGREVHEQQQPQQLPQQEKETIKRRKVHEAAQGSHPPQQFEPPQPEAAPLGTKPKKQTEKAKESGTQMHVSLPEAIPPQPVQDGAPLCTPPPRSCLTEQTVAAAAPAAGQPQGAAAAAPLPSIAPCPGELADQVVPSDQPRSPVRKEQHTAPLDRAAKRPHTAAAAVDAGPSCQGGLGDRPMPTPPTAATKRVPSAVPVTADAAAAAAVPEQAPPPQAPRIPGGHQKPSALEGPEAASAEQPAAQTSLRPAQEGGQGVSGALSSSMSEAELARAALRAEARALAAARGKQRYQRGSSSGTKIVLGDGGGGGGRSSTDVVSSSSDSDAQQAMALEDRDGVMTCQKTAAAAARGGSARDDLAPAGGAQAAGPATTPAPTAAATLPPVAQQVSGSYQAPATRLSPVFILPPPESEPQGPPLPPPALRTVAQPPLLPAGDNAPPALGPPANSSASSESGGPWYGGGGGGARAEQGVHNTAQVVPVGLGAASGLQPQSGPGPGSTGRGGGADGSPNTTAAEEGVCGSDGHGRVGRLLAAIHGSSDSGQSGAAGSGGGIGEEITSRLGASLLMLPPPLPSPEVVPLPAALPWPQHAKTCTAQVGDQGRIQVGTAGAAGVPSAAGTPRTLNANTGSTACCGGGAATTATAAGGPNSIGAAGAPLLDTARTPCLRPPTSARTLLLGCCRTPASATGTLHPHTRLTHSASGRQHEASAAPGGPGTPAAAAAATQDEYELPSHSDSDLQSSGSYRTAAEDSADGEDGEGEARSRKSFRTPVESPNPGAGVTPQSHVAVEGGAQGAACNHSAGGGVGGHAVREGRGGGHVGGGDVLDGPCDEQQLVVRVQDFSNAAASRGQEAVMEPGGAAAAVAVGEESPQMGRAGNRTVTAPPNLEQHRLQQEAVTTPVVLPPSCEGSPGSGVSSDEAAHPALVAPCIARVQRSVRVGQAVINPAWYEPQAEEEEEEEGEWGREERTRQGGGGAVAGGRWVDGGGAAAVGALVAASRSGQVVLEVGGQGVRAQDQQQRHGLVEGATAGRGVQQVARLRPRGGSAEVGTIVGACGINHAAVTSQQGMQQHQEQQVVVVCRQQGQQAVTHAPPPPPPPIMPPWLSEQRQKAQVQQQPPGNSLAAQPLAAPQPPSPAQHYQSYTQLVLPPPVLPPVMMPAALSDPTDGDHDTTAATLARWMPLLRGISELADRIGHSTPRVAAKQTDTNRADANASSSLARTTRGRGDEGPQQQHHHHPGPTARLQVLLCNATNPDNLRISPQHFRALDGALRRLAATHGSVVAHEPVPATHLSLSDSGPRLHLPAELQINHCLRLRAWVGPGDGSELAIADGGDGEGAGGGSFTHHHRSSASASRGRSGAVPLRGSRFGSTGKSSGAGSICTKYTITCRTPLPAVASANVRSAAAPTPAAGPAQVASGELEAAEVEVQVQLFSCAIPSVDIQHVALVLQLRGSSVVPASGGGGGGSGGSGGAEWRSAVQLAVWLACGLGQVAALPSSCVDAGVELLRQLLEPATLLRALLSQPPTEQPPPPLPSQPSPPLPSQPPPPLPPQLPLSCIAVTATGDARSGNAVLSEDVVPESVPDDLDDMDIDHDVNGACDGVFNGTVFGGGGCGCVRSGPSVVREGSYDEVVPESIPDDAMAAAAGAGSDAATTPAATRRTTSTGHARVTDSGLLQEAGWAHGGRGGGGGGEGAATDAYGRQHADTPFEPKPPTSKKGDRDVDAAKVPVIRASYMLQLIRELSGTPAIADEAGDTGEETSEFATPEEEVIADGDVGNNGKPPAQAVTDGAAREAAAATIDMVPATCDDIFDYNDNDIDMDSDMDSDLDIGSGGGSGGGSAGACGGEGTIHPDQQEGGHPAGGVATLPTQPPCPIDHPSLGTSRVEERPRDVTACSDGPGNQPHMPPAAPTADSAADAGGSAALGGDAPVAAPSDLEPSGPEAEGAALSGGCAAGEVTEAGGTVRASGGHGAMESALDTVPHECAGVGAGVDATPEAATTVATAAAAASSADGAAGAATACARWAMARRFSPLLLMTLRDFGLMQSVEPLLNQLPVDGSFETWEQAMDTLDCQLAAHAPHSAADTAAAAAGPMDVRGSGLLTEAQWRDADEALARLQALSSMAELTARCEAEGRGEDAAPAGSWPTWEGGPGAGGSPPQCVEGLRDLFWVARRMYRTEEFWQSVCRMSVMMQAAKRMARQAPGAPAAEKSPTYLLETCVIGLLKHEWIPIPDVRGTGDISNEHLLTVWTAILEAYKQQQQQQPRREVEASEGQQVAEAAAAAAAAATAAPQAGVQPQHQQPRPPLQRMQSTPPQPQPTPPTPQQMQPQPPPQPPPQPVQPSLVLAAAADIAFHEYSRQLAAPQGLSLGVREEVLRAYAVLLHEEARTQGQGQGQAQGQAQGQGQGQAQGQAQGQGQGQAQGQGQVTIRVTSWEAQIPRADGSCDYTMHFTYNGLRLTQRFQVQAPQQATLHSISGDRMLEVHHVMESVAQEAATRGLPVPPVIDQAMRTRTTTAAHLQFLADAVALLPPLPPQQRQAPAPQQQQQLVGVAAPPIPPPPAVAAAAGAAPRGSGTQGPGQGDGRGGAQGGVQQPQPTAQHPQSAVQQQQQQQPILNMPAYLPPFHARTLGTPVAAGARPQTHMGGSTAAPPAAVSLPPTSAAVVLYPVRPERPVASAPAPAAATHLAPATLAAAVRAASRAPLPGIPPGALPTVRPPCGGRPSAPGARAPPAPGQLPQVWTLGEAEQELQRSQRFLQAAALDFQNQLLQQQQQQPPVPAQAQWRQQQQQQQNQQQQLQQYHQLATLRLLSQQQQK